jgi:hypothetical protein
VEKTAAIYARVSSDQQKENHTIQSQTAALIEYAKRHGYAVPSQWQFQDEGYSGATLLRPGLEAVRDLAAAGQIAAVLVYSPDRLSRKYAYQVLPAEEFSRCGVELVFLQSPWNYARGSAAGAVPRHDCRVRTSTDCRGLAARQTASCPARINQCALRRALRLPLREEK